MKPPSQASVLVDIAVTAELFATPSGEAYAVVDHGDHRATWRLRAGPFRRWLQRRYHLETGTAPNAQAVQDAIGVLEGKALFESPEYEVHTRIAEHEGAIYLDLADEHWRAVEVTAAGWQLVSDPPVRFRRASGMLPLPAPERGGSVEELRAFVNVGSEDDWRLLVAFLVAAFRPGRPFTALGLHGIHGSAKSTQARILRELIDPNVAPIRSMPRNEHDLVIAASNGWLVVLDNISDLKQWLSDALCRLTTGGGLATRALYTDDAEVLFDVKRPVILTGIEDVATSPDLIDRSLIVNLPEIPERKRRPEETFYREFNAVRPRVLGALLDAVAAGLANGPTVELDVLPRMADFAKWVHSCEPGLDWPSGAFLASYTGNRAQAHELAVEACLVGPQLRQLAEAGFEGTSTELLERVNNLADERVQKTNEWPKTGRAMSGRLRRIAPDLRTLGYVVELDHREPNSGRRLLRMGRPNTVTTVTTVTATEKSLLSDESVRDGTSPSRDGSDGSPLATVTDENPANGPIRDGSDGSDGHEHPDSEAELIDQDLLDYYREKAGAA
jgi:hypothetical protein